MCLWNPVTGTEEACTHLPDSVRALTVLPDGRLAVAHGMHVAMFRLGSTTT